MGLINNVGLPYHQAKNIVFFTGMVFFQTTVLL